MKQFLAALIFSPIVAFAGNGAGTMSHSEDKSDRSVIFLGESNGTVFYNLSMENETGFRVIRQSISIDEIRNSDLHDPLERSVHSGKWEIAR